jgi:NAD-dependent deacetylase
MLHPYGTLENLVMNRHHQEVIDAVVRILDKNPSILFVTGAGISADSGVPTYRGIGGLYDIELTEEGFPIEDVLSGAMFRSKPELTWKYLSQIANAARGASYNRAHEVIAKMEQRFPRVWTLTQNVDGFHRAAGAKNVIEIHGNMHSLLCTRCDFRTKVDEEHEWEIPPRCPDCSAILRPDVVLFGEMLPTEAVDRLVCELATGFGVVFSVGTSSLFPYIQEPVLAARRMGIPTIEINPSETELSSVVDYRLPLSASRALEEIWNHL